MYNIAIIGAGALGSRHLQGAKQANLSMNIYVVDIDPASLSLAKQRYEEINANEYFKTISFLSSLAELPPVLDIVIVATNSAIRSTVILELLRTKMVYNFLLEKFLFQSEEEYIIVQKEFDRKNVKCWVDCGRRLFSGYQELKKEFSKEKRITFNVSGSNWGLGCNAIHFIDLFAYFIEETDVVFDEMGGLYSNIYESKRKGYVEFDGTITGKTKNGNIITLTSSTIPSIPIAITMQDKDKTILIVEEQDMILIISNGQSNSIEKRKVDVKFQSQLTGSIIEQILNGSCELTEYQDSMKMHLAFLKPLLSFYNSTLKLNEIKCPIT